MEELDGHSRRIKMVVLKLGNYIDKTYLADVSYSLRLPAMICIDYTASLVSTCMGI